MTTFHEGGGGQNFQKSYHVVSEKPLTSELDLLITLCLRVPCNSEKKIEKNSYGYFFLGLWAYSGGMLPV